MAKDTIRERLRENMRRLDRRQLQQLSAEACERLCRTAAFEHAGVVMMFLSLPAEIDTSRAILRAFQGGKTVLVPSIVWRERHLIPLTIHTLDCEMTQDRHGLRYPSDGVPMPASEIDLAVVPGLGFDEQGNRLGRGGGFYDRFLVRNGFKGIICGFGLEQQVLDSVPVHEHDIKLDMLVTETRVRPFTPRGQELR